MLTAISGVEVALWDLLGKDVGAAGLSVARRQGARAAAGLRQRLVRQLRGRRPNMPSGPARWSPAVIVR